MHIKFPVLVLTLAACRFEPAELAPLCDPVSEVCPPGAGSDTASTTTGDVGDDGDGIQTVTGVTSMTTATTTTTDPDPDGETASAPEAPAIESVSLTPSEPLKFAGAIEIEAVAIHAEGVRLEFPNAEIELEEGVDGHFHGQIDVPTGLTNGTYEATLIPWRGELLGEPETRHYTLDLPTAGELFLWDTMPDHGSGRIEVLRVTESGQAIGFGTLYENGTPRCFLHRRDLEGKYTEADDIRVIFADKTCVATDLEVDGEALYVLVSMVGGDGPRWRVGVAAWGEEPTILGTGVKDEVAHALALSPSGKTAICGTAPSLMPDDTIDGRVWSLKGAPVELDYIAPDDPQQQEHRFDETLRDCAFVGERLVAGGDVFGQHEQGVNPKPPKRTRPLILELDGEDGPVWQVSGLGPGNTTQGSISELAIDGQGRYVTGLYTCGDACDPQGEIHVYEPGGKGKSEWRVTLGAGVLPPQDIAWSPAGYLVVASAEVTGDWSSKFVLQAFVPELGQFEPVWSFSKAEIANVHLAHAVAVGPGAVIGGGLGGAGFPALAFLRP